MSVLIFLAIFVFGLVIGSFLNVVILRLPERRTLGGRSTCFVCSRTLAWYELIPLVSFLILRARCRTCRAPISWQYPLVELATALLFLFVWLLYAPDWLRVTGYALLVTPLIVIFVQDLRWGIILDVVTLPAIVVTLLLQVAIAPAWTLVSNLGLGMLIGGGFFTLQYLISRGRWIGGGDIRLGVLMGAMLGWKLVLVALMLAYIGGAIIALFLLVSRLRHIGDAVPFGVFLVPATIVVLFYGEPIIEWYLSLAYIL